MLSVFPVAAKFTVCSPYGPRGGSIHRGIDLCAATDSPLLAVEAGTANAGTDPKGGNVIVLRSSTDAPLAYYYAHLSAYEGTFPRAVAAGDTVGYVGTTGNAAGGPAHVHFECWPTGVYTSAVDPWPLLRAIDPSLPARPAAHASPWPALFGGAAIVSLAVLAAHFVMVGQNVPRRRLRVA